jgi:hypothetical protein
LTIQSLLVNIQLFEMRSGEAGSLWQFACHVTDGCEAYITAESSHRNHLDD